MTCRPSLAPPLGSPVLFRCCLTHAPHFSSLRIKGAQPVFQSCYKDGKQCLHSPESLRGPGRILLDYYVLSIKQKVMVVGCSVAALQIQVFTSGPALLRLALELGNTDFSIWNVTRQNATHQVI